MDVKSGLGRKCAGIRSTVRSCLRESPVDGLCLDAARAFVGTGPAPDSRSEVTAPSTPDGGDYVVKGTVRHIDGDAEHTLDFTCAGRYTSEKWLLLDFSGVS
jgi:hypothetical protein